MSNPSPDLPEIADVKRVFYSALSGELFGEQQIELLEELERTKQALREKDTQLNDARIQLEETRRDLLGKEIQLGECQERVEELKMKLKLTQDHLHDVVHDVEARIVLYEESRIRNPDH